MSEWWTAPETGAVSTVASEPEEPELDEESPYVIDGYWRGECPENGRRSYLGHRWQCERCTGCPPADEMPDGMPDDEIEHEACNADGDGGHNRNCPDCGRCTAEDHDCDECGSEADCRHVYGCFNCSIRLYP